MLNANLSVPNKLSYCALCMYVVLQLHLLLLDATSIAFSVLMWYAYDSNHYSVYEKLMTD